MSYMTRLEEAHRRLVAGEFHEAETLYWEACAEWERSRVRGPLVDKGVEPLLRWSGRIFGRDPAKPVFQTFERRAPEVRAALTDVAAVLADAVQRRALAESAALDAEDVESLRNALFLRTHSQLFALPESSVWPVTRAYLSGCRQHGLAVDPGILPPHLYLEVEDLAWLVDWTDAGLGSGSEQMRAVAPWILDQLAACDREGSPAPLDGRALGLASRLAYLDPLGAPRALQLGLRALRSDPLPPAAKALVRLVGGLACNEERLASGRVQPDLLNELAGLANVLDVPWPGPVLREVSQLRRLDGPAPLAVATWDGVGAGRLLVLRCFTPAPCDAILLALADSGTSSEPFAATPVEARRALAQWVAADAPILVPGAVPGWVRGLLDQRPIVDVAALDEALPAADAVAPPEPPCAPHPLFDETDALATPWASLLRAARGLIPRLDALTRAAAYRSEWGVENLRRLGEAGLMLSRGVASVVERMDWVDPHPVARLDTLETTVSLRWPPLSHRPWPAGRDARVPDARPTTDLLRYAHPSEAELAGWAGICAPCEVLAAGTHRAREVAGSAATLLDPRTVTLAPAQVACPEPVLKVLDRWIEAAVTDERRAADVLWLYGTLCTMPDGDLHRWVKATSPPRGGRSDLDEALAASPLECPDDCRLTSTGCLSPQLDERREAGMIWVEPLGPETADRGRAPRLLVDDLLHVLADREDPEVAAVLERVRRRLHAAQLSVAWMDAPHFAGPLTTELARFYPHDRVPQIVLSERTQPLALYWPGPGYSPGSLLLRDEAGQLLGGRLADWLERAGSKAVWCLPREQTADLSVPGHPRMEEVHGAVAVAAVDTVLLPRLAGPDGASDLTVLLRLAAAATHARTELVCLDPRLMGGRQLVASLGSRLTELVPGGGVAHDGRGLLDRSSAGSSRGWTQPLTESRLELMEGALPQAWANRGERRAELARGLARLTRGGRAVVGGIQERERELIALCAARLSAEAGDGGPLDARCAVWVSPRAGTDMLAADARLRARRVDHADQLDDALSEVERGRLHLLSIPPGLLVNARLQEWARRARVFWVAAHGELLFDPDGERGATGRALVDLVAASESTLLITVDARERAEAAAVARLGRWFDAAVEVMGPPAGDWSWRRVRLADPAWSCPSCRHPQTLPHAYALCETCGQALVDGESSLERAQESALRSAVQWLGERDDEAWTVIAATDADRDALRRDLGWSGQDGPLLQAAAAERTSAAWHTVVVADDLWSHWPPAARVVTLGIPPRRGDLEQHLLRLEALGFPRAELTVLDHPLRWHEPRQWRAAPATAELPTGRVLWRWESTRPEIEFRCRQTLLGIGRSLRVAPREEGWPDLGPDHDPAREPATAQLTLAMSAWAGGDAAGSDLLNLADADLQELLQRARGEVALALDTMEAAGVTFGREEPMEVDPFQLEGDGWRRRANVHLLTWLWEQGLLSAQPTGRRRGVAGRDSLWLSTARNSPLDEAGPIPAAVGEPSETRKGPDRGEAGRPDWVLGVAGSGKTTRVRAAATAAASDRARALVLLPRAPGLLAWGERGNLRGVEVATVEEFCLAFLRRHHEVGGFARCPQLLPLAQSPRGREVRESLLKEVSRRYAETTGRVPAAELSQMYRVLEGESVALAQAAEGEALDLAQLRKSAEAARWEAGWLTAADLRQLSRQWLLEHPYVAQAWRDRYQAVFLDDADALRSDELAFVDAMFPPAERWTAADPLLLDRHLHPPESDRDGESYRLTKDQARAAARLLLTDHADVRMRGKRRGKTRVEGHRVLNLETCADVIRSGLHARRGDRRVGVVVTHLGDARLLASRLREAELSVWMADEVAALCAPGPRQFLALAHLLDGLGQLGARPLGRLAQVALMGVEEPGGEEDPESLGRFLSSLRHGVGTGPRSPREAFLEPLEAIARDLDPAVTAGALLARLRRTHLLAGVAVSDAASGRLVRFVEGRAGAPWTHLLQSTPPEALIDPLAPGSHVWLVQGDDLPGLVFDEVYYLCTGHEPGDHHYRVVSRVTEALHVLYSERDPFKATR